MNTDFGCKKQKSWKKIPVLKNQIRAASCNFLYALWCSVSASKTGLTHAGSIFGFPQVFDVSNHSRTRHKEYRYYERFRNNEQWRHHASALSFVVTWFCGHSRFGKVLVKDWSEGAPWVRTCELHLRCERCGGERKGPRILGQAVVAARALCVSLES